MLDVCANFSVLGLKP